MNIAHDICFVVVSTGEHFDIDQGYAIVCLLSYENLLHTVISQLVVIAIIAYLIGISFIITIGSVDVIHGHYCISKRHISMGPFIIHAASEEAFAPSPLPPQQLHLLEPSDHRYLDPSVPM